MYIKSEKHEEEEIGGRTIQKIRIFFPSAMARRRSTETSDKMVPVCAFTGITAEEKESQTSIKGI